MKALDAVRHISVSIDRPFQDVYAFVSNPENVPKWASGLGGSIERSGEDWVADSPMGRIKIRFARKNDFGVLDHDVILESGESFHNPMRVIPHGEGSEVVFTLFHRPDVPEEKFIEDVQWIEKDLKTLKSLLER